MWVQCSPMLISLMSMALAMGLISCASGTIVLESVPSRADVFITPAGGDQTQSLGQTPLTVKANDLAQINGRAGPYLLTFKKERFNESKAVITDIPPSDINFRVELAPVSGLEDQDYVNEMLDVVFDAQRLALAGRFDEALQQLKRVQQEVPQLAASYEMEGGIYFLQKRYTDALDAYRTAAKYNPKNPETTRMRNYLEQKLGIYSTVRAPASVASASTNKTKQMQKKAVASSTNLNNTTKESPDGMGIPPASEEFEDIPPPPDTDLGVP